MEAAALRRPVVEPVDACAPERGPTPGAPGVVGSCPHERAEDERREREADEGTQLALPDGVARDRIRRVRRGRGDAGERR